MSPETASREILWNVSSLPNVITMYAIFAVSLVFFFLGIFRRFRVYSAGKPDATRFSNIPQRVWILLTEVLGQKKVREEKKPGYFHTLIAFGFVVLVFTTTMVFIDHDLGIKIFHGRFYLAVSFMADIFGFLLLVGILIAYHRRYIEKPDRLHNSAGDAAMLWFLALMVIQGFWLEAIRIKVTADPWAAYTPVGYLMSFSLWGLSEQSLRMIHYLTWWFHAVTVFAFIGLLPYTKFHHLIASSVNLVFRNLERPKGALSYPGDIESIIEEAMEAGDDEFSIGVRDIQDTTWKQRMDFDACTSCGRCQSVCPAYNSGKVLSPKWLILDSRDHLLKLHSNESRDGGLLERTDGALIDTFLLQHSEERCENPLAQASRLSVGEAADAPLAGGVMDENVFWMCTTCRACMEVCPVGIEHVDFIVDVRRSMALMEGNIPKEAQGTLRAIETRGNPFGPAESRVDWAEGVDVPILDEGAEVDVLYWVGCVSAYDKRKQSIARAVSTILNKSGVSWGILGNEESCTGDPARRLGEENLFQTQAKTNLEKLSRVKFKTMVANCPHCFNTMKNEYPQIGAINARVVHHTQLIKEFVDAGKIELKNNSVDETLTYHDPCYLGRYNDEYDAPRELLVQIGSQAPKEMKQSRERGLCCGAGGGHFWMDIKQGERVNVQRVEQAAETQAETVSTGCPFCLQMLEDGAKLTDREQSLKVKDVAELVAESIR